MSLNFNSVIQSTFKRVKAETTDGMILIDQRLWIMLLNNHAAREEISNFYEEELARLRLLETSFRINSFRKDQADTKESVETNQASEDKESIKQPQASHTQAPVVDRKRPEIIQLEQNDCSSKNNTNCQ
jgi:hypothetical protein